MRRNRDITYSQRFLHEANSWLYDLDSTLSDTKNVLFEIKKHCNDMLIYSVETATRVKATEIIRLIDTLFAKNVNDSYESEDENKENKKES